MIKLYEPAISEDDRRFVYKVLCDETPLTNRENGFVRMFEKSVEKYLRVKHAIAVSSGTAALHLAFALSGGTNEVIPAFTFPAVEYMSTLAGQKSPCTKDIDPRTYNIDIGDFTEDIKNDNFYDCIVPVHMFGQSANMDAIMAYKRASQKKFSVKVRVIEDAACALGAKYKDQFCGTIGDVGCFSFHPRKIITTGEGGMLVTNDEELADRFRLLRSQGMRDGACVAGWGFNYRLSEMAGALGYSQMKRLDRTIERRRQIADVYNQLFDLYDKEHKVITPIQAKDCFHTYQSYVVRIKNMNDSTVANTFYQGTVMDFLKAQGVDSAIGSYCLDARKVEAKKAADQTIALPIHTKMSDEDVMKVVKTLLEVL